MTITIPDNYKWLLSITDLPRTIEEALKRYNVIEAPGPPDNPTIMGWRDELLKAGVNVKDFTHDSVPWCGLFAAIVVFHRMNDPKEVVEDPLWALNWAKYGVKSDRPSLGDVLTFVRNGGGHVGFYVGEDSSCYHVYGGNQSDRKSTRLNSSH